MLKSNNKFTSAIKSIAIVLALIAVLVMSLAGCTDEEARKMAQDAADKANAAITQTQLNDAVTAALADYAKKTDAMTADGVAAAITAALEGYAKTADLTLITMDQVTTAINTALANYPTTDKTISKTEVEALISAAQTTLGNQIATQAGSTLKDAKDYADSKIDIDAWHALTGTYKDLDNIKTVVGACRAVDNIMRELVVNAHLYTAEDLTLASDLCEAAKVRFLRATSLADLNVEDLEDEIAAIPTLITEAERIAGLIDALNFPITTWDEEAVEVAVAEFATWKEVYEVDDAFAVTKGINVEKLEYAVAKKALLIDKYTALNTNLNAFITALGNSKIALIHGTALAALYDEYTAFVGTICTDEACDFAADLAAGNNNGTDGNKVPAKDTLLQYLEDYNNARFEDAKVVTSRHISAKAVELIDAYAAAADAATNELLREAIAQLSDALTGYILYDINYNNNTEGEFAYGYTNNYELVYQRAYAHLTAVETALINDAFAAIETAYTAGNDVLAAVSNYVANTLPTVVANAYTATAPQA